MIGKLAVCLAASLALCTSGCDKKDAPAKSAPKAADKKAKTEKKTKKPKTAKKAPKKGGYEGLDAVPDAGSIAGVATYTGSKTDGKLKITKDNDACGTEIPETALEVADGKLKNVLVYLRDIKKGKRLDRKTVSVDNKACYFVPRVSVGWLGGRVAARNSDPILHNTNLSLHEGAKTLYNIALPQKDQTVEKKLKKPGMVDIRCDAHAWMAGFLYVSPHPYAMVTGADGAFELKDVPPGEYTLVAWHEKLGEKTLKVKVEKGAPAKADVTFAD